MLNTSFLAKALASLENEVQLWFNFREARNITSHAYDEDKSWTVFHIIPDFMEETKFLITKIISRLQDHDQPKT